MYRPQFPFSAVPEPCEDLTVMYTFDQSNLPAFGQSLAAGQSTGRIPLNLDQDAPFLLRAITAQGGVSFRIEDPNGNALSDLDNSQIRTNFEFPPDYARTNGAGFVALESGGGGVFAPQSGNFLLYLYNGTAGTIALSTVAINLIGIKRYRSKRCM